MSVRRVACPGCDATLNVPMTMTNIRCSECGTIWDVNNPPARRTAPVEEQNSTSDKATEAVLTEEPSTKMLAGLLAAVVSFLVIALVLTVLFTGGTPPPPETEPVAAVEEVEAEPNFEVVNLPEGTRKRIYSDFRQMTASSIEKQIYLPTGSNAHRRVSSTLQSIVERDVQQQAIIYNVTEREMYQIIAEGDWKGWPPRNKNQRGYRPKPTGELNQKP